MDCTFWQSEVSDLGKHSWAKDGRWPTSNRLLILPRLPLHLYWLHHLWLVDYLCNLIHQSFLKIFTVLPGTINEASHKGNKCRLRLPILVVLRAVIGRYQGRVSAICDYLPAQPLLLPISPLVQQNHLYVRSHKPSLAQQLTIHGQLRIEVYLVCLPWRARHYQIVAFVDFVVAVSDIAGALPLLDLPHGNI